MKQITLDWDTYQQELKSARDGGFDTGVFNAIAYVRDGKSYSLSMEEHYRSCKQLEEAIQDRLKGEEKRYLQDIINDRELVVFNEKHKSLDTVISITPNDRYWQLNLEKEES